MTAVALTKCVLDLRSVGNATTQQQQSQQQVQDLLAREERHQLVSLEQQHQLLAQEKEALLLRVGEEADAVEERSQRSSAADPKRVASWSSWSPPSTHPQVL